MPASDLGHRFAFTGREWDPDAELYYYRARWYDPHTGRFLSRDPSGFDGGDVNLYRYAGNDPVNQIDPSGLRAETPVMQTLRRIDKAIVSGSQSDFDRYLQFQYQQGVETGSALLTAGVLKGAGVFRSLGARPTSSAAASANNGGVFVQSETASGFTIIVDEGAAGSTAGLVNTTYAGVQLEGHGGSSYIAQRVARPVSALRTSELWGTPKTLADHFRRHGADFGSTTADKYVQQASYFFQRSQLENLPTKVDPKGVIRVYDPKTNTFGSFDPDGTAKTLYKPDPAVHKYPTNVDYWNAQPGTSPWTPQ